MDYGISTHLFHGQRLGPEHLREIAAHGFRRVEVFATRTHFDFHDDRAIAGLGEALAAAGLSLHSMHAPIVEGYVDGKWGAAISLAASDPARRELAVRETQAVIALARELPYEFLVVHMGVTGDLQAIDGANMLIMALEKAYPNITPGDHRHPVAQDLWLQGNPGRVLL